MNLGLIAKVLWRELPNHWVRFNELLLLARTYRTHLRSFRRSSKIEWNQAGQVYWWDIQVIWQTKSGKSSSRYYYLKRRKPDRQCGQKDNSSTAYFISSGMDVIGQTCPEICRHIQHWSGHPPSVEYGITKTGVRMALSNGLRHNYMAKCANKSKKTAVDDINHDWLTSGKKYLQCQYWVERVLFLQMY